MMHSTLYRTHASPSKGGARKAPSSTIFATNRLASEESDKFEFGQEGNLEHVHKLNVPELRAWALTAREPQAEQVGSEDSLKLDK